MLGRMVLWALMGCGSAMVQASPWIERASHAVPSVPKLGIAGAVSIDTSAPLRYAVVDNQAGPGSRDQRLSIGVVAKLSTQAQPWVVGAQVTAHRPGQSKTRLGSAIIRRGAWQLSGLQLVDSGQFDGPMSTQITTHTRLDDLQISYHWSPSLPWLSFQWGVGQTLITYDQDTRVSGQRIDLLHVRTRLDRLQAQAQWLIPLANDQGGWRLGSGLTLSDQSQTSNLFYPSDGLAGRWMYEVSGLLNVGSRRWLTVSANGQRNLSGLLDPLLRMPMTGFDGVLAYEFGEFLAANGDLFRVDHAWEMRGNQRISVFANYASGTETDQSQRIEVADAGFAYAGELADDWSYKIRSAWPLGGSRKDLPGSQAFGVQGSDARVWAQIGIVF